MSGHGVSGTGGVGFGGGQVFGASMSDADFARIKKHLCPGAIVNICACSCGEDSDAGDYQTMADKLGAKVCYCVGDVAPPCECLGEWKCKTPKK